MSEPAVWVFFYGSYMNRAVLAEVDLAPAEWRVAWLGGFDIRIQPRANLVRSEAHHVHGVLATATHRELERLYAHSERVLGEVYRPEAVLAQTLDGQWRPALCYIAAEMVPRPAESDYLDRIIGPARQLGFPAEYVQRLERFRP